MKDDHLYRPGVGLMVLNRDGYVFMGERMRSNGEFQMPQGGIDEGEDIEKAVFRELYEETGMKNANILTTLDTWLYYDFPDSWRKRLFQGRYKGQRQKWFLLEFLGEESEINLQADEIQEFSDYKWVLIGDVPDMAIAFKRDMYYHVCKMFQSYIDDNL